MNDTYSVIIPAFNEEELLSETLTALKTAMSQVSAAGEVIVVDNNSTDGTAQIARDHEVEVVFEPVNQISRARNAGAKRARGRHLVFLDADTIMNAELLKTALANLSSGDCCGGGTVVEMDRMDYAPARRVIAVWNWVSTRLELAAGCFIYCLREGFDVVGGFSEAVYASEEIWFSRRLRAWGKKRGLTFRIVETAPIVTSSRKLDWYSPLQLILFFVVLTAVPFGVRFRSLCAPWYKRPARTEGGRSASPPPATREKVN